MAFEKLQPFGPNLTLKTKRNRGTCRSSTIESAVVDTAKECNFMLLSRVIISCRLPNVVNPKQVQVYFSKACLVFYTDVSILFQGKTKTTTRPDQMKSAGIIFNPMLARQFYIQSYAGKFSQTIIEKEL